MAILGVFPWTIWIIVYMVVVHIFSIPMGGTAGLVFMVLCMLVLLVEFFKSSSVHAFVFLIDLLSSVIALVVATALITYLLTTKGMSPSFYDWFGFAILLGDAIVSPFNSFRSAMRDMQVSGGNSSMF